MSAEKLLCGNLDQLPPKPLGSIRVFISSTFTDMTEERNILMNDVVPEIRKYCSDKGFDFEVVDMRWGVREDAFDDHTTTDIVLRQIDMCQQMSLGPNFILFAGEKYGSRPLPNAISVTEFRLFRRIASWNQLKFDIVEKWYLLDTNAVPHVYQIQPVSALLPYVNNMNSVHETMRLVHQQNWECDERLMKSVLRKIAVIAVAANKISSEAASKYFVSVTEHEIERGIFTYPLLKDKVIYLDRTFINLNTEDKIAKRFIDLTPEGETDEEAQDLRNKLRHQKLPQHVPYNQTVTNTVTWTPKGIDPDEDEHARYLTMMSETLKTHLIYQIDKSMAETKENRIENPLVAETHGHLLFSASKSSCFFGYDSLINDIYNIMNMKVKSDNKDEASESKKDEISSEIDNIKEDVEMEKEEKASTENEKEEDGTEKEEANEENNEEETNELEEEARDKVGETLNGSLEDDVDERDPATQANALIQQLYETYKKQGVDPPTVAIGDNDDSGDPNRNMKEELISFTCTKKQKHPVILYGESGCGKTALMARLAKLVKIWHPEAVVIIRFLGTTAQSSNIRGLLTSLIHHIWAVYKISRPTDMDFSADIIYLGQYLQALIWKVVSASKPLFIFLDSLDQLARAEQAHGLAWLPVTLPIYCHMLVSTLPDEYGCLDSARRVLPSENLFIEVPPLHTDAANKIISAVCNEKGRALTRPQRTFLLNHFKECPTPLYLRLIINQSLTWRSHYEVKDLILGSNTPHAIIHLLMNLEKSHGIILVSKAFGYLTAMKQGVSILEMDDILSLDNEVLHDTYIYHLPPCPTNIRLPPSLWARVIMDVGEYLTGEMVHGKMVQTWYHRQFKEVAMERYLSDDIRPSIHRQVAHYFLGTWHNKIKPLCLYKEKKGWYPENTRGVPDQPLRLEDGSLNVRKLTELPHHLALAGMWREFHKEITCNIEWLVAKVKTLGVTDLKADLMLMLGMRDSLTEDIQKEPEDKPPPEDKGQPETKENGDETSEEKQKEAEEDTFITENKKADQEDSATVKDEKKKEEKELKEAWITPEPEYVPDLATAMRDLEILIDIVMLGIDCIRHSAENLPVQIICQLGKNRATSPGLRKLVEDSYKWLEDYHNPLFIPQDCCMPAPGEMLQTTLSAELFILGSDRTHDFPVDFSKEDNYLYVVQQNAQKADSLIVLDLNEGGERVMLEDTKNYIHSVRPNVNEKFLIVCYYKTLSGYNPVYRYLLYERGRLIPYKTEKEAIFMDVSRDGDIVAYADEHICYVCSPVREQLKLEIIYRLHHPEILTGVRFSPDAYYLLTFLPNDGFKVWIPRRGETTLTVEGKKVDRYTFRETSGELVHITVNHQLIQVLSGYQQRNTLRMYDLSNGDILHQLSSSELNYSINFMEFDKDEEYVLVATEESSILNGNKSKSALLWDTETGKLVSRVNSDVPFDAIKLLVSNKTIYILATFFKDSSIYVFTAGPQHRPLAGTKLVRKIVGHSRRIIQMVLAVSDNTVAGSDRLMSISADNSIKIWDLRQVLKPPPKTKEVDIGTSVDLIYSKDGSKIYFATDKGFIIRQCAITGTRSTLACNLEYVAHILLMSKNGHLLIAAMKNLVHVYCLAREELEYELESCTSSKISCMAENNNVLITGHSGMEAKGRIWDLSTGRVLKDVTFLYSFYQTAVNSSGTQFGISFFEYPVMMNVFGEDEETNMSMAQVDTTMSACSHMMFSPDAKMLIATSSDGRIRIIDTETGRYLHTMIQRSSISSCLVTWDSQCLITAGYRSVYFWNIGSSHPPEDQGQLEIKLNRHGNFITQMQLVLDDRFLLTASLDKTVALWSMKTKTTLCSFCYHCAIDVMAAAPDLSTLAFVPERAPLVAVLSLNKAGKDVLKGIPSVPVPTKVKKAQAVALSFSSQQITKKTSTACSIL